MSNNLKTVYNIFIQDMNPRKIKVEEISGNSDL